MVLSKRGNMQRAPQRLLHILRILAKHGLLRTLLGKEHMPPPKSVREAIEELGLTFIKFGQVLAMRRDLLPDAYIDELELLHDQVPAMSLESVRATIESDLGAPLSTLFSSFGETPLGAASIAQVHKATLPDGRPVAVKVRRPGLSERIAGDISALTYLVLAGEKLFPRLRAFDLHSVLREFSASLNRETDFGHEARTIMIFRGTMAEFSDLWIPGVVADYSQGSVLTLEFSAGERIDFYARQHPELMPEAMNTLVRLMMQTIFEEGLFHADPHPGNVFVLPDGRLSLLDFGSAGELDERIRESLSLLLEAVINGDARAATEAYLEMSPESENVNRVALLGDIKAALYEIRGVNLSDVSIGNIFEALVRAGTRNGVRNPSEFVLLTRAVVILESMIRQLAPNHNYMESFREQLSRLTVKHFSQTRIAEKSTRLARDFERLVLDAPADTRRILRRIAEGNLGRLPRLESMGDRLGRKLERLAGAVAYAALVISGSMLLLTMTDDWHHSLGEIMIGVGIVGMLFTGFGALRRGHDQRH